MAHPQPAEKTIALTLPDGTVKQYAAGTTGEDVALSIGPGLAKAAIAVKVNGEQRDLDQPILQDAKFQILTLKDPEGLEIMRHTTTAQLLALAVKELYPAAKLAIGPTIEHGFYYDIDLDEKLNPDDLPKLEARMHEILKRHLPVKREMVEARGRDQIIRIARRALQGRAHPHRAGGRHDGEGKNLPLPPGRRRYGVHRPLPWPARAAFLENLAGVQADPRPPAPIGGGDAKNKQLQRIYGLSFATEKELKAHLHMLEEAEKRDHRKLGRELDLFPHQEEAVGQIFWHDKGWTLFRELENYIRRVIRTNGYQEVKTPILMDRSLWEASGPLGQVRREEHVHLGIRRPHARA